jgi:hypothetical protein
VGHYRYAIPIVYGSGNSYCARSALVTVAPIEIVFHLLKDVFAAMVGDVDALRVILSKLIHRVIKVLYAVTFERRKQLEGEESLAFFN